jgi:hypothetical protein
MYTFKNPEVYRNGGLLQAAAGNMTTGSVKMEYTLKIKLLHGPRVARSTFGTGHTRMFAPLTPQVTYAAFREQKAIQSNNGLHGFVAASSDGKLRSDC